jgi:tetratricopeptide (TPR) repeat protein
MFVGLFVTAVLGAPPLVEPLPLGWSDTHKDGLAWFGAAIWNLRRDRLLTATRQLENAARSDPDSTAPLRELVRIYAQIGREPEAIRLARRILEKDPHDVDTAHTLARLLFDAGDLKGALAASRLAAAAPIAMERADKAVAVLRDLATLSEKASDYTAAQVALSKALELLVSKRQEVIVAGAFTPQEADRAAAECLERLGKVLTKRSKFDDAATAFSTAARLFADPLKANDPEAAACLSWNLSEVFEAKNDPALGLKYLEAFLKYKPAFPEPYLRLVRLLRASRRDSEVLPTLRRYFEADSGNLALQAVLAAEMAREPETRRQADEYFARLLAKTNDRRIIEVILRSHLDTERPREIIAELDRVLTLLEDKGERGQAKPTDTPEVAGAKEFAAEKARVIGEILKADLEATEAVLRAASDDIRLGTKRVHQTYYFLGQLAARHHRLELAASQFRQAIANATPGTNPGDAYVALIDVLWMAGKPSSVASVCRQGLQNADSIAPVYFNFHLASALAELGDANAALAAADKAIEQTSSGDRLTVRLGKLRVLRTLGRWDDAIALGKKLFEEFDSVADRIRIRYALAGVYWAAGQPTEAETELRAILDRDPDHAPACNDLGFHLADQGRNLEEAERLIRNAIAVDRLERKKRGAAELENAAYIDSLGWVLFRQGKLPEARLELERATTLPEATNDPVIWDHLGDVLFRLGEKDKAKAAWEKALFMYENEIRTSSRSRRDGRLDELKRKLKHVP